MTTYTKQTWTNEVPETIPVKFKITDDTTGVVANSAKIELITSVTSGTPVDATHLNHMEDGIYNAQTDANTGIANAATAQTAANTAITNAATAQTTANNAQTAATNAASNSIPKNIVTTAGDLIVASGTSTPSRLAIGSEGKTLAVKSGSVAWALQEGASCYQSGTATISQDTWTTVALMNFLEGQTAFYDSSGGKIVIPSSPSVGTRMYYVMASGRFAPGTGYAAIGVIPSGTDNSLRGMAANLAFGIDSIVDVVVSGIVRLAPGDNIVIKVFQHGQANLSFSAGVLRAYLIR